jgi:hypothetical protein
MRIRAAVAATLCAALTSLALGVGLASAHTVSLFIYAGKSIDGKGNTFINAKGEAATGIYESEEELPWRFSGFIAGADIHQADGNLIVFDDGYAYTGNEGEYWQGMLSQFSGAGVPVPFSGLTQGVNAIANIPGYSGAIAVDNSGTSANGNIYIHTWDNAVRAYDASGTPLGGNFPIEFGSDSIGGLAVSPSGQIWVADRSASKVVQFTSGGSPTGLEIHPGFEPSWIETDGSGNIYVTGEGFSNTVKFDSAGNELFKVETEQYSSGLGVDPANGNVYIAHGTTINAYKSDGTFISSFGGKDPDHSFAGVGNAVDIAVNGSDHSIYVVDNSGGPFAPHYVHIFEPTGEITVPDVTTGSAEVTPTTATVHGTINPDGLDTTDCHFEYGPTTAYNEGAVTCAEGKVLTGSADSQVSAVLENLTPGTTYHYRLVSNNVNGVSTPGADQTFKPLGPPIISNETVSDVNTDNATVGAEIDPSGLPTTYHFEIGTDTSYGLDLPNPDGELASVSDPARKSQIVGDTEATRLQPDSTYHFRVVATNGQGTTEGSDHTFHTFPNAEGGADPCPNAHERQQTSASLLLDCRAYELVSARNAGGYDVQSDVIVGQGVLTARPDAKDQVLYSLHFGKVPGVSGGPTNFGLDPYVASRGANGWSTRYVGLPANETPGTKPFGSPISGSAGNLSVFAFGGSGLCAPCFSDGSTGIPVRLADGSLVQGMKGSLNPGPGATQAGFIGRRLSDDGTHLVFGSTSKFEEGAIDGDVTIYDRDLTTNTTHIVSRTPGGATMTGSGNGELAISANGSRILLGNLVSTDPFGVKHWHPYLNVNDSNSTIDLAPTTTTGVIFSGMSADGTIVYFVTRDKLVGGDTDNSTDLYRADISGGGATLTEVSTGSGGGNTDSCTPVASFDSSTWNNLEGTPYCDVVAFAGGAGVSDSGTVYFLSPEKLDGQGTQNRPNLFVSQPGQPLRFVATIEPSSAAIHNALTNNEIHTYGDLQTTPDGKIAVFDSRLSLTEYPNAGHSEIYRYDYAANQLLCVSCAPTRATATGDTSLSLSGLNLSDDGRVFFSSPEQLVLRDANGKRDAYEWEAGRIELISTGADPADAGLLSVSANGVNAYFFTRATLVPEDENADAMKIYDARERGGFASLPAPVPCQASDECHGAGSQAAPPVSVGTLRGELGNVTGEACDTEKLKSLAKSQSHRAGELRRRAKQASGKGDASAAKRYRKQAQRLAKAARKAKRQAAQCVRQSRRGK